MLSPPPYLADLALVTGILMRSSLRTKEDAEILENAAKNIINPFMVENVG